ncbi:hypothetical protein [Nonomuraea sp. NPDC049784]|jgi:hypothetical protein
MKRKVIAYLPFFGIVLVTCASSWLAGRKIPGRETRGRTIGR